MLQWLRQVLARRPVGSEVSQRIDEGRSLHARGDLGAAEACYRRALEEDPDNPEALYLLGDVEAQRAHPEEAMALLRRAISLQGDDARYHFALGCVLHSSGDPDGAAAAYRRALALDAAHVPARINLGSLLQARSEHALAAGGERRLAQEGLREALALFASVTELAPQAPEGWLNLGYARSRAGELAEARACYERALALEPGLAEARFNRALVLLAQGQYREGWEGYEWRWQVSGYPRPAFARPEWDGRPLGPGQTLFVYTEQGFGDAIQFARYAQAAAQGGARVLLRCQPELRRLLASVRGVAATLDPDQVPEFDFHCSLISLGRLTGTTLDTIPTMPYVAPDPPLVSAWRERLAGEPRRKIGLVWASQSLMPNAALKSMALDALAPLASVPDVRFYSLQTGAAAAQASRPGALPLADLTAHLRDFADTAALVASLDLVISVDTAVAHLAGAMGKRVWTLLQHAPDWRWYPEEPVSRWYPTMRLYRQQRRGDWRSLAETVTNDLRGLVAAPISPT